MKPFNWKQFVLRIPVKAPATAIIAAWTSQEALESWFLRSAVFVDKNGTTRSSHETIGAGDRFTWLWHGHGDEAKDENEVLAVNAGKSLQFTFADRCIVTVSVKEEAGETICELVQEMTMEDEATQQYFYIDCGKGWTFYLANLKSILEGGPDLRNKNKAIQNVVNA